MAKDLRDKLRIGMHYDELVQLLGTPSHVEEGAKLFRGATIVASSISGAERTKSYLRGLCFCCWRRPEAEYYLTLSDGRLESIHQILPPMPSGGP